jgi:serine/threonine-protein kinase
VRLDVPIAIKVLKPGRLLDAEQRNNLVSSFLVEARTTAKLRHPNIAQVIDTGVLHTDEYPDGVPWTVFEWLEGSTLDVQLKQRRGSGGRSPREAWTLFGPVIDAIATAHEAGIAHRDLKPSNVMLVKGRDGKDSPRVLDFGIAKLVENPEASTSGDTSTESAFVAFSPGYAAPEQISRSRTGLWTDVHALGLILTEILTDQKPYVNDQGTDLVVSIVDDRRPTPKSRGIDVGAWEPVLARALALAPRDRYANAGELQRALEAALDIAPSRRGKSIQAPSSKTERIGPVSASDDITVPASETALDSHLPRPRRPLAMVSAMIVIGGAAIGTLFLLRNGNEKAPDASSAPASPAFSAPPPELVKTETPPAAAAASAAPAEDASIAKRVVAPSHKRAASAPSATAPPAPTSSRVGTTPSFE